MCLFCPPGSELAFYAVLVLTSALASTLVLAGFIACLSKNRAKVRKFCKVRTRRHFYIRNPKFFYNRQAYLKDKETIALGVRTQSRREATNIKMPLCKVS